MNVCCIPPYDKTVKITWSLHIDYMELRNDDNFLLKISLAFCHLHINGIGYTIDQGEQASDVTPMDDAMR